MTEKESGESSPAEQTVHGGGDLEAARVAAGDRANELLRKGETDEPPAMPDDLRWLKEKLEKQEIELKETYAKGLLKILRVELVVSNAVFIVFAWAGKDWNLSTAVIDTWLAATVIQVIGVVTVVTRHLFPIRDKSS